MASLLGDIESSFFNSAPSPAVTPASSPIRARSSAAHASASALNTSPERGRNAKRLRSRSRSPSKYTVSGSGVPGPSTPKKRVRRSAENTPSTHALIGCPIVSGAVNVSKTTITAVKQEEDLSALLDGLDDAGWDDILSPRKPKPSPKKASLSPKKALFGHANVNAGYKIPSLALSMRDSGAVKTVTKPEEEKWTPPECTRCIVESVEDTEDVTGLLQKVIIAYSPQNNILIFTRRTSLPGQSHYPSSGTLSSGTTGPTPRSLPGTLSTS
jgi:hypothetical protein